MIPTYGCKIWCETPEILEGVLQILEDNDVLWADGAQPTEINFEAPQVCSCAVTADYSLRRGDCSLKRFLRRTERDCSAPCFRGQTFHPLRFLEQIGSKN